MLNKKFCYLIMSWSLIAGSDQQLGEFSFYFSCRTCSSSFRDDGEGKQLGRSFFLDALKFNNVF